MPDIDAVGYGRRAFAVGVNGERIATDGLVLSPGARASELTEALGFHVPVEPQRGQFFTSGFRVPTRAVGRSSSATSTTTI